MNLLKKMIIPFTIIISVCSILYILSSEDKHSRTNDFSLKAPQIKDEKSLSNNIDRSHTDLFKDEKIINKEHYRSGAILSIEKLRGNQNLKETYYETGEVKSHHTKNLEDTWNHQVRKFKKDGSLLMEYIVESPQSGYYRAYAFGSLGNEQISNQFHFSPLAEEIYKKLDEDENNRLSLTQMEFLDDEQPVYFIFQGTSVSYYKNGGLKSECEYNDDGMKTGLENRYSKQGDIILQIKHEGNGKSEVLIDKNNFLKK